MTSTFLGNICGSPRRNCLLSSNLHHFALFITHEQVYVHMQRMYLFSVIFSMQLEKVGKYCNSSV